MYDFGIKLKELRIEKNLSQQDLGNLFNVSRTAVHCWEQNKQEPDMETILAIAKYFNVPTDYLLGAEENIEYSEPQKKSSDNFLSKDERTIIDNFKSLEPHQKNMVVDFTNELAELNQSKKKQISKES